MIRPRCISPAECCYDQSGGFVDCYYPGSCDMCIDGRIYKGDPVSLALNCKECALADPVNIILSKCEIWEECCYGVCYNKNCEQCNHTTKKVESKCIAQNKICCKNFDGSISDCYDPKDCKKCQNGIVVTNTCDADIGEACCPKSGICYNIKCDVCDSSTGKVIKKCSAPNQKCCPKNDGTVTCFNPDLCQKCNDQGVVEDIRTPNQINLCYQCDQNGIVTNPACSSNQCCGGICITSCQTCTADNKVVDQCDSDHFCCDDECLPKDTTSTETCKGCAKNTDGSLYVVANKCINNTDGKTSCCNGVCFDDTCQRCNNNSIEVDLIKSYKYPCCGDHKLVGQEQCCRSKGGRNEVYISPYDCCENTLGDTGVYNEDIQGCCTYGDGTSNTLYDKLTHDCCTSALSPTKTFDKKYFQCCGTDIINKLYRTCCNNEYSVIKNCEKCEKDNNNNIIKQYNEDNCEECFTPGFQEPKILSKCRAEINNGQNLTCCEGTGKCYDTISTTCYSCDQTNRTFTSNCPVPNGDQNLKACCDGVCYNPDDECGDICYNTPNNNGGATQRLQPKCPKLVWSKAFDRFFEVDSLENQCCGGTCIDPECYDCDNNTPISKCPGVDNSCCPGIGCYKTNCKQCKSFYDTNGKKKYKIINKGQTLDAEGNISGDDQSCIDCCNNECCSGNCCGGECCSADKICCNNTCVPLEQCCNNQVLPSDMICCGGQPHNRASCAECCENNCINSGQKCCRDSSPNYSIPIDMFCCNGVECVRPCCQNICCPDNLPDCCGTTCYKEFDCQRCSGKQPYRINTNDDECCAGVPYSPKDCEKCINGIKIPYTPTSSICYCVNGMEFCDCPTINTECNPRSDWQSSGFFVGSNMNLLITASGTVNWMGADNISGPDGVDHPSNKVDYRFPHEALLGRIGTSGPIFLIGSRYEGIPGITGELFLATNDIARGDNSGSFSVTITCTS